MKMLPDPSQPWPFRLPANPVRISPIALMSVVAILLSFLLVKEAAFGVAVVALLANLRGARVHPEIELLLAFGITIVVIGVGGLIQDYHLRDIIRDLFSFSVLPVFLLSGLWIGRQGVDNRVSILIQIWSITTLCFLLYLSLLPEAQGLTRQEYRAYIGYSVPGAIFMVPLAIWEFRSGRILRPTVLLLFAGLAVYITDSRAQLFMSIIAAAFAIVRPARFFIQTILLLTALFTFIFATPLYEYVLGSSASASFRISGPEAVVEWMPFDYAEESLINSRWRAFEGFRAYKQWTAASLSQQVMGQGAGAQVALGRTMKLGADVYQAVPTVHNGWSYILTKGGCYGVLYVMFIMFYFGVREVGRIPKSERESSLVASLVFCILLSFPTSTGFFNSAPTGTPIIFFWGLALGWAASGRAAARTRAKIAQAESLDFVVREE